ncbi:MAG: hypothetical protein ACOC44_14570 [Promethearchaeia archaeon]
MECPHCNYKIVKPYPKDQLCPRCNKFVPNLFEKVAEEEKKKPQPKEFKSRKRKASSKLKGKVKVKKKANKVSLDQKKIELKKGEYIKLVGITSVNRTPLFCSNKDYEYLLELTNNLDFIATSILEGKLDKMLLISEDTGEEEKCQFYLKDDVIYIIYGRFPDKKGKWFLEQMQKHYSELVLGREIDGLEKIERHEIEMKFKSITRFLLKEYLKMQEVFSDKEIPYVEDKLRVAYLGLSSKSIGVISLLLSVDLAVDVPGNFDSKEEEMEMKESVLTAKIEAIAANTLGNTGAVPRWISVKSGFQNYRFLTFKKYKNNYFLYCLSEGNLRKLESFENQIDPILSHVIDEPFSGNLKPFNKLKKSLKDFFNRHREFE